MLAIILCMLLEIQWIKVKKELNNGFKIIGNWFQEKAFTAYTKLRNDPKQAKTKQNEPKGDLKRAKTSQNNPKQDKTSQKET